MARLEKVTRPAGRNQSFNQPGKRPSFDSKSLSPHGPMAISRKPAQYFNPTMSKHLQAELNHESP
jgi:hypothetical protein